MKKIGFVFLLSCAALIAADWLNVGGDAKHSGFQSRPRFFRQGEASGFVVLWKKQLPNAPLGSNGLTAPIVIGPIVTHRGIKEMIFVAGSSNKVFSVDADLGRVLWTRDFQVAAQPDGKSPCGEGMTAAMAMEPENTAKLPNDEDDPDFHAKMRPLYALTSDGILHTIWPSTGLDSTKPLPFLPAGAHAGPLTYADGKVSTTTTNACNGTLDALWSIDVKTAAVTSTASKPIETTATANGWIYEVTAYGVTATHNNLVAWKTGSMLKPLQPAIVKGVVFVLDAGSPTVHAKLYAFDAATGKQLYQSGDSIESYIQSSALAVANGHVTFATADNTLYCFGFPLEI